ncbi:MAG: AEC family transporter [Burkholderiales bacterium]
MLVTLVMILAPIALSIAVGYLWVRMGRAFDSGCFGAIAADIAMPCLIFSSLAHVDISAITFARTAIASLVALLTFAILGALVLHAAGMRLRTYLPSVTWGNAGFLGIPLSLYAFGSTGLVYAVTFSAVSLIFNSIFSQAVSLGRADMSALLRVPLIYAAIGGAVVASFQIKVPAWLLQSISLIGGMAVPLVLMMVGASLARIKPVVITRAAVFSIGRVMAGAAIAVSVAWIFGITGIARNVLVLQCAMPVAALAYVFAQKWNNDPEEVASLVAVSTWISVVSVPVMLGLMSGELSL